jgi:hypothetical protein
MATGDTKVYRTHLDKQNDGTAVVDFNSDTVKMMLLKSSYTPDYTTGDYAGSFTANQVTAGTAYTDGGVTLSAVPSMTVSGSFAIFKAGTISIAQDAGGFATARYGLLYKRAALGTLAESPVIALVDLGSDRANTAGPLLIYWTGNKIIKWQY